MVTEPRRADSLRPGDVIHTRGGVHTILATQLASRIVTVTATDRSLGEMPLMYLHAEFVRTDRRTV